MAFCKFFSQKIFFFIFIFTVNRRCGKLQVIKNKNDTRKNNTRPLSGPGSTLYITFPDIPSLSFQILFRKGLL